MVNANLILTINDDVNIIKNHYTLTIFDDGNY